MLLPIEAEVIKSGARHHQALALRSPYHPAFVAEARKLGGSWAYSNKTWRFDARDSDKVAALCERVYGYDWMSYHSVQTLDISLVFAPSRVTFTSALYAFGRLLLEKSKHGALSLGAGVLLLAGGYSTEGDSCTLEIRDVPEPSFSRGRGWWEDRGAVLTIVHPVPQRTLPVSKLIEPPEFEDHPQTVTAILKLWRQLDAREQGRMLEILRDDPPPIGER